MYECELLPSSDPLIRLFTVGSYVILTMLTYCLQTIKLSENDNDGDQDNLQRNATVKEVLNMFELRF